MVGCICSQKSKVKSQKSKVKGQKLKVKSDKVSAKGRSTSGGKREKFKVESNNNKKKNIQPQISPPSPKFHRGEQIDTEMRKEKEKK